MNKFYFLGILLSLGTALHAQEMSKHHASINPINLTFGTAHLSYEYAFNQNMSAAVSVGQKFSSGIMSISGFDSPTLQSEDFSFKGIKIIPEYRWYLQKTDKNHTGFFVGAYYKFQSYESPLKGVYTVPQTDETANIDLDARISTHALGLQIGYKLPIYKNWYADFLIAGPGYSINTLTLTRNQVEIPEFYQDLVQNIRDKYKEIDQLISNSEFKRNSDGTKATATFRLPAFRYGVSVGYRF